MLNLSDSIDERLFLVKFAPLGGCDPGQYAVTVRVFKDGEVIPHRNNNRLEAYTTLHLSKEGQKERLVGHYEDGRVGDIWIGPWTELTIPSTERKLYDWIVKQARRLSSEHGLVIHPSSFFQYYMKHKDKLPR